MPPETAANTDPDATLTVRTIWRGRGHVLLWSATALLLALAVAQLVLRVTSDASALSLMVAVLWLLWGLAIPIYYLVAGEVRAFTVSATGISWRGVGWQRSRPWSDLEEVGTLRLDLGAGGTWIAARLAPEASRSSAVLFPRRLRRDGVGTTEDVAGLVRLLLADSKRPRPGWDVPDDEIVAAVRTHAGDRWVGDLGPVR